MIRLALAEEAIFVIENSEFSYNFLDWVTAVHLATNIERFDIIDSIFTWETVGQESAYFKLWEIKQLYVSGVEFSRFANNGG